MGKDASSLPVGTILDGRFRIVNHLSSGGFGKTYFAVYGSRNTKVAIKEFFMNSANQRGTDGVSVSVDRTKDNAEAFSAQFSKFKKEYERLKQISNVHVVRVHEYFEENGTAYYVMDFVEGSDLDERLKQRGKPYAEKTVLKFAEQILDGLQAIHSAGLLHLDIKPKNIMITSLGYVKLIDLGASKDYDSGNGATAFTGIAKTERFAPPEQAEGAYEKFGPWTDFYALGATLYYLLSCNQIPLWSDIFEDDTDDKRVSLPMPEVSARTKELIVWMMSSRNHRPRNVDEIRQRMNAVELLEETETVASSGEFRDGTTVIIPQPIEIQTTPQNSVPDSASKVQPAQKEAEFSVVGCFYILVIIAIIVFAIKFLFLS